MTNLEEYYNKFNEDKRLKSRHGQVEYNTTMAYIRAYLNSMDDPKIADIMPYASRSDIFKDKYFKLEEDKVCKTITAHMKFDCNMYIHPTQARGLTPREAARVQSFPDSFEFLGNKTIVCKQIGNAVPPKLSFFLANAVSNLLCEQSKRN